MNTLGRWRSNRLQRGSSLMEFALVSGLLFLILFGIIEMGLMFKDKAILSQAAREASRSLGVGSRPGIALQRAETSAAGLGLTWPPPQASDSTAQVGSATSSGYALITLTKTTPDASGNPTTWSAVGVSLDNSTVNDASAGDLVKATITYNHPLVSSFVFSTGFKTEGASVVMRRE